MKIKIVIMLPVICCLLFCSCNSSKDDFSAPNYPVIEYPTDTAKENVGGYREKITKTDSTTEDATVIYYANKKSKKIHLPTCTYAKKMNESSIRLEEDINVLYSEGYTSCSVCKP